MTDPFAAKLAALGFALPSGHRPPSERLVRGFERRFGLDLPRLMRVSRIGRHALASG